MSMFSTENSYNSRRVSGIKLSTEDSETRISFYLLKLDKPKYVCV